jgi:hypothetical protein
MKNSIAIAVSLALLAAQPGLALAAGVSADTTVKGTVNAAASGTAAGAAADASTSTKVSAGGSASASLNEGSSYADVTASLSGMGHLDLSLISTTSDIRIVKVSSLKGFKAGANASMSADVTARMKDIDAQAAANASISAKLKAAGYSPNDVVAISTAASGVVTVFVNS